MQRPNDMLTRRGAIAAACLGALTLGACAMTPTALEPPQVRLAGLALRDANLGAQHFRVGLDVRNPNSIPVPVEQLRFSVRLAGGGILDGRSVDPFTLAPGEAQLVQLDVETDLVASLSRLSALLQGPGNTIAYDLDGSLELSRGVIRTLPFSHRGEIALSIPAR